MDFPINLAQVTRSPFQDSWDFFNRSCTSSQWTALWIWWILFALIWLARRINLGFNSEQPPTAGEALVAPTTTTRHESDWMHRFRQAEHFARDALLTLLTALTFNSFARGSSCGISTLTWIFFALATLHLLLLLLMKNLTPFYNAGNGFILMGLALAMFIIALSTGWVMGG